MREGERGALGQGARGKRWHQTMIAIFQIAILSGLGIVIGEAVHGASEDSVWKFTLWVSWLAAIVAASFGFKEAARSRVEDLVRVGEEEECYSVGDARQLVRDLRRPRTEFLEGVDEVCDKAAGMIHGARKEREPERRWVLFIGAASLGVPDAEFELLGGGAETQATSPFQDYVGAIESAVSEKIVMRRLVHLPNGSAMRERSERVRREYGRWLTNQYAHLRRNDRYELVDIPRAPVWGATSAMIVTSRGVLEVVGKGEAGIWIVDDFAAEVIRHHAGASIEGSVGGVSSKVYGSSEGQRSPEDFGEVWSRKSKAMARLSTVG